MCVGNWHRARKVILGGVGGEVELVELVEGVSKDPSYRRYEVEGLGMKIVNA